MNVQYVTSNTYYVTSSVLTSSCVRDRMLKYHEGHVIGMLTENTKIDSAKDLVNRPTRRKELVIEVEGKF